MTTPSWLTRQVVVIAALVLLIAAVVFIGPAMCQKIRSQGAQSRMDAEQGNAMSNSAADAVGTVARSGEEAAASEELTRENEKEIRNAQGADERVGAGVNAAGLRSLCRRAAYRDHPRCRVFNAPAR
jgi:flagellar biosynthesis/type III secretory pathway M-ring protein FliF/YscJ